MQEESIAAAERQPKLALVFEPSPLAAVEVEMLIAHAALDQVSFIGIVSALDRDTSLPLHRLLGAANVPVHVFPRNLHPCLLRALKESSNIQVLGYGEDPRGDLMAHLEEVGQFNRQRTTSRQAVA